MAVTDYAGIVNGGDLGWGVVKGVSRLHSHAYVSHVTVIMHHDCSAKAAVANVTTLQLYYWMRHLCHHNTGSFASVGSIETQEIAHASILQPISKTSGCIYQACVHAPISTYSLERLVLGKKLMKSAVACFVQPLGPHQLPVNA